jgi:ketosteroid isomerase-like protein
MNNKQYPVRHFMRYTRIIIVAATLLSACHKKPEVSHTALDNSPLAAWGATKDDILARLMTVKARIITDTDDVIVAEVGPEGLTSDDGKPVTHALRTEYDFKDGKLAQCKCFP